jgi:hypothetical protein
MKNIFAASAIFAGLGLYAQEHYSRVDLYEDDFDEFEILNDTLKNYSVYFTGENHMFATFNTEFQYKFLTYLHENHDVNHFIFEQSPAVGYIIEKVIIEDKTASLHYLQDMFYDPFYELVKDLRKYNDSLPLEDKIRVHGIDAERFPYFSVYALDLIVDTLATDFEGGGLFEQIKALASANYDDTDVGVYYDEPTELDFNFEFGDVHAWSSLKSIIDGANEMKDSLVPHLGADSDIFYAIIKSLEAGREWYLAELAGDVKSPIIRERYMSDEFERVFRNDPDGKYYGQFGRCHLHKDPKARSCYDYYMNSIANRIAEIDPALKGKVLVIPIFYTNSRNMDHQVLEDLDLDDRFIEEGEAFIVSMDYKNNDHFIPGFFEKLPFVIISNVKSDAYEDVYFSWEIPLEEYHLGFYYGYRYFTKIRKLNSALEGIGSIPFTDKYVAHTYVFDYISMDEVGVRGSFTYLPSVSNGDRFHLNGYLATIGSYYPFGNRYIMCAVGYDYGYGKMWLLEEADNTVPNLIQQEGKNINLYSNDVFVIDPNVEFRLTLPVLSFNFKAGYAFDISGKYWKLDGKMKEFTKTSFSFPYIQAGLSLNFKM